MLPLRSHGRHVLSALLLLIGVGTVLVGGFWLQPRPDAVLGRFGRGGLFDNFDLSATAWPWIFASAGLLIASGAALTMITASRWPSGSDRFQPDSGKAGLVAAEEPGELWKAMDAGVDPTTDDHDTLTTEDPKMRDRGSGDTMDGTEQAQQLPWSPTSPNIGNSMGQVQRGHQEREV
jgi:hypothetical protein